MSEIIVFNVTEFRAEYPEFQSVTQYPDSRLEFYWELANCYIANNGCNPYIKPVCLKQALYLMTAHLAKIGTITTTGPTGQTPGMMQSAAVDKVNVSLTPPPLPNQFQWWLNLTSYGQQLLALLQVFSVGGLYIGGNLSRAAYAQAPTPYIVPYVPGEN